MQLKRLIGLMMLMILPGAASGGTATTTLHISARVEKFAEWADAAPVIVETDWPGAIHKSNQARAVSRSILLYSNTDAVITAKPGLNGGVLTNGAQTLATAYKITGAVTNPDRDFKPPSAFFGP